MDDTVTSPTGDTIRLIPPDELTRLIGADGKRPNARTTLVKLDAKRRGIVEHLWRHGPVEDRSGLATARLAEHLADHGIDSSRQLPGILSSPVLAQCVARTWRGRRTYKIELVAVPCEWWTLLDLDRPAPSPVDAMNDVLPAHTDLGPLDDTPPPMAPPAFPADIASAVAAALLAQVADIIGTGDGGTHALDRLRHDIDDLETRLGQQVGYVDKLRRQLRDAQDTCHAVMAERDGLRIRLRTAERNLSVATSADTARIVDAEVKKELARVMRETPVGPNSHRGFHP